MCLDSSVVCGKQKETFSTWHNEKITLYSELFDDGIIYQMFRVLQKRDGISDKGNVNYYEINNKTIRLYR